MEPVVDCGNTGNITSHLKNDFDTESRHIRVENRRHTGVCRGFPRRINAEFGTKDFFSWLVLNIWNDSIV
jgi:hypothetical protein